MPLVTSAKTVTTSPTLLASPTHGSAIDPIPVQVFNNAASATVYVGGGTVTTATGVPLAAQTSQTFALMAGDDLYGIVSADTAEVRVMMGRS